VDRGGFNSGVGNGGPAACSDHRSSEGASKGMCALDWSGGGEEGGKDGGAMTALGPF
jgi:hypothetical protein